MCTNNGCFLSSGISCNNAGTQLVLATNLHGTMHRTVHTENYLWLMTNTWSRVHLEKLNANKFSAFYGTRKLIIAFTTARHLYMP